MPTSGDTGNELLPVLVEHRNCCALVSCPAVCKWQHRIAVPVDETHQWQLGNNLPPPNPLLAEETFSPNLGCLEGLFSSVFFFIAVVGCYC